jgi:hypothetical protein
LAIIDVFPKPITVRLRRILLGAVLFYLVAYIFGEQDLFRLDLVPKIAIFVGIGLYGISEFIPRPHTSGAYLERLEAYDQRPPKFAGKSKDDALPPTLVERLLVRFALPATTFVLVLFVVYAAGRYSALNQSEFFVASTSPETAVLWIDGDKIICAPFNRNTGEVEPSFLILDAVGNSGTIFRLEKIGPLRLKEESVNQMPEPALSSTPAVPPTQTPSFFSSPISP